MKRQHGPPTRSVLQKSRWHFFFTASRGESTKSAFFLLIQVFLLLLNSSSVFAPQYQPKLHSLRYVQSYVQYGDLIETEWRMPFSMAEGSNQTESVSPLPKYTTHDDDL
ncbi:hypothetical protein SODALDRAFT_90461 [Sodiomyces alkalinus F11]|uniref:Uncharacterized protein n=1 Tax=Sodiomyces alkalinus (strain CBS 110278 / VKM F-3762 / F11) TaxID=1314773 RepID=A0A3N2Q0P5_SODAK|nr:hypothetical protein SODALDRAFT_90461 [Sodiomyces alkalinus F11]ROT40185.1 hypothetical protein SODALDRAFT_90461 [Sodiomyces alkalinus F11]